MKPRCNNTLLDGEKKYRVELRRLLLDPLELKGKEERSKKFSIARRRRRTTSEGN